MNDKEVDPLYFANACPNEIIERVNYFDNLFNDPNNFLRKMEPLGKYKIVNQLIDFVNVYIEAGATTPEKFHDMEYMETLDVLIGTNKFDLALEFSGVNKIDFFQYLFVKYHANESILEIISPKYPLSSLTMALSSLSPIELEKYEHIIMPKNSSKPLKNLYKSKSNTKQNEQRKSIKEVLLNYCNNDENDNKTMEIDDYLYCEDISDICVSLLDIKDVIPLPKLKELLEFCICFTKNEEINNLKVLVTFLLGLENIPQTLKELFSDNNSEIIINNLIQKHEYLKAKTFSQYAKKQKYFIDKIMGHILNLITINTLSNNLTIQDYYKLDKINSYRQAIEIAKEFLIQIIEQLDKTNYFGRFCFLNELKKNNFSYFTERKDLEHEYEELSLYFSVDIKYRPKDSIVITNHSEYC